MNFSIILYYYNSHTNGRNPVPLRLRTVFADRLPPWKPVGVWLGWMTWERDGGRRTDEFGFFCTTPPVKHKSQAWFNLVLTLFLLISFCQVNLRYPHEEFHLNGWLETNKQLKCHNYFRSCRLFNTILNKMATRPKNMGEVIFFSNTFFFCVCYCTDQSFRDYSVVKIK